MTLAMTLLKAVSRLASRQYPLHCKDLRHCDASDAKSRRIENSFSRCAEVCLWLSAIPQFPNVSPSMFWSSFLGMPPVLQE